jgi:SM-20-related protein
VSLSADLSSAGISIQDRFLSSEEIARLRESARQRELRGEFAAARIGGAGAEQRMQEIRGDFTCWLREPLLPPELRLFDRLEQLRLQLNREAFLGVFELEAHYARYPAGASYARHVDQPHGTAQRRLSLVLYLNPDWRAADGGQLRVHLGVDGFVDVEPNAGTLVCFLTAGCEHEVLMARRERLSISGWFRARE